MGDAALQEPAALRFWLLEVCVHVHMWWGRRAGGRVLQGFAPIPKSSSALALCGIPNISYQIKVAENTQDLSGLVGGSAGVTRLRTPGLAQSKV